MPSSQLYMAKKMAESICEKRTLLFLDGLEALQNPPYTETSRSKLNDEGIRELLDQLAKNNHGLCVITTREEISELKSYKDKTCAHIQLTGLSNSEGRQLLTHHGVKGKKEDLEDASEKLEGHPMAIRLLAFGLEEYDGDVSFRDGVMLLGGDEEEVSHAMRVMNSVEKRLGESTGLAILRIMGLFNRPAEPEELQCLRSPPHIAGLNTPNTISDNKHWNKSINALRSHGLLSNPLNESSDSLDCHPLIREYFQNQLRKQSGFLWRKGHERLYNHHLKKIPAAPSEFESHFLSAILHGCLAGKHQEVINSVYLFYIKNPVKEQRILANTALSCLEHFFSKPWILPLPKLNDLEKVHVLLSAGENLEAIGQLSDALSALEAALSICEENVADGIKSEVQYNVCKNYLAQGDLSWLQKNLVHTVQMIDKSEDLELKIRVRIISAIAHLYLAKSHKRALSLFYEAETILREKEGEDVFLTGFDGFYLFKLLWYSSDFSTLPARSTYMSKHAYSATEQGLAKLCGAQLKALNINLRLESIYEDLEEAIRLFNKAEELPLIGEAYLLKAEISASRNEFEYSEIDLGNSRDYAEMGFGRLLLDVELKTAEILGMQRKQQACKSAKRRLVSLAGKPLNVEEKLVHSEEIRERKRTAVALRAKTDSRITDNSEKADQNLVYVSYSRADIEFLTQDLKPALNPLEAEEHIELWEHRVFSRSNRWHPDTDDKIKHTKLAILLITQEFLGSNFCMKEEVPLLIDLSERGEIKILALYVEPCYWESEDWRQHFHFWPNQEKAITEHEEVMQKVLLKEFSDLILQHIS